jgi:hypothetical protein
MFSFFCRPSHAELRAYANGVSGLVLAGAVFFGSHWN